MINYIHEPTPLQCGQAVLAMLTDKTVDEVVKILKNERETTLKEMLGFLNNNGFKVEAKRYEAAKKESLPEIALLSLETPRCWHWSLYYKGTFYDPEHNILSDFPACNRKYYWKVEKISEDIC